MTSARIDFGDTDTTIVVDGGEAGTTDAHSIPYGVRTILQRHIHTDPPLPEELTNAIGEMVDHLEDAKRELPSLRDAVRVVVHGPLPAAIAAVEVGRALDPGSFRLERDAAEDVFRTIVTESRAERLHNPGLRAELADDIVAGSCALVGLLRALHLDGVDVVIP